MGRIREEKEEERRSEKRKSQKKEDAGAQKRRSRRIVVYQFLFLESRKSKSRLARAIWSDEISQIARVCCTKRILKPKPKTLQVRGAFDTFGSTLGCGKCARPCGVKSGSKSKNPNAPGPEHLWKLRCGKSARSCCAKHIRKPKCSKHRRFGSLSISARRSSAKLISKSKSPKHPWSGTLLELDVEKVHAAVA